MQTRTIEWRNGKVVTIDQTRLPHETVFLELKTCEEVAEAIKTMKIRGAPLLGAAAAFALALAAYNSKAKTTEKLVKEMEKAAETLKGTRPTAFNLFWAIDRILEKAKTFNGNAENLAAFVIREAQKIADEDVEANRSIGKHGASLIAHGDIILTHCNAGALATVGYGTALGVIRAAWENGKRIRVIATETRPKLQGARLTTYELKRDGIPVTLITDSMVGYVMHKQLVNKVVVGADRIVKDAVINKIGTFTIAVLAKEHNIPFYVAAPKSTFDLTRTSADVVIEERSPEEVTYVGSERIAVEGIDVLNPAFDITPLEYVTAIICESGILYKEDFGKFRTN
ncbi:MAG: S-methyl-5-thioribose-1-phosphate isomerase [Candidatus Bathyarchaeota archaeon]|nr:MAG: S-methyl-5-thioribose-1-phosphate isomerase [Candidatus Bathyarchaeota archaeon]